MSRFVAFRAPPLIKYCDEKYNVEKGCNTIRLGTLYGYRKETNEKLRDEGEGEFGFRLNFGKPTFLPVEWVLALNLDISNEASFGSFQSADGGIIVDKVELNGSVNNCWLFCMSMGENESAGAITDAHNSFWRIDFDQIEAFASYLGGLLWNSLSLSDLAKSPLAGRAFEEISGHLSIRPEIHEIKYVEREVLIADQSLISLEALLDIKRSIPFIKPKLFQDEREVRIAFWIDYDGEAVSAPDIPKILNLRPIEKYFYSDW